MANYCNYEIHVRGKKKAALMMCAVMATADSKWITHEEGTDDEYVVWFKGDCKWSLDAYCEEKPDVTINLDEYTEEDIRDADFDEYWYLTMRQKSELLGLEILAHSWSDESEFNMFEYYNNGRKISSENVWNRPEWDEEMQMVYCSYIDYCLVFGFNPSLNPPPVWDKEEYPTYEEFCYEYDIDPEILPESKWEEDEDNMFVCIIPDDEIPEVGFVF